MTDEVVKIEVLMWVVGIDSAERRFYRSLRKMGFQRFEANLITAGFVTARRMQ